MLLYLNPNETQKMCYYPIVCIVPFVVHSLHVSYAILCSGSHEVLLGVHDFDDFDNGGQPEVYDIDQIIVVCFQIELF